MKIYFNQIIESEVVTLFDKMSKQYLVIENYTSLFPTINNLFIEGNIKVGYTRKDNFNYLILEDGAEDMRTLGIFISDNEYASESSYYLQLGTELFGAPVKSIPIGSSDTTSRFTTAFPSEKRMGVYEVGAVLKVLTGDREINSLLPTYNFWTLTSSGWVWGKNIGYNSSEITYI